MNTLFKTNSAQYFLYTRYEAKSDLTVVFIFGNNV